VNSSNNAFQIYETLQGWHHKVSVSNCNCYIKTSAILFSCYYDDSNIQNDAVYHLPTEFSPLQLEGSRDFTNIFVGRVFCECTFNWVFIAVKKICMINVVNLLMVFLCENNSRQYYIL